jgi:tRNA(fMet)-specific endonuclease VapC
MTGSLVKIHRRIGSQATLSPNRTKNAAVFEVLDAMKLGVKTMDLRIAAIARSPNLTVITRSLSDFSKVPRLKTEDDAK